MCRRKFVLHYFGEEFNEKNCNEYCDNCKNPKERKEGSEFVQLLLKSVEQLNESQKAKHYCAFLSGNITSDIKNYQHDKQSLFGSGKEKDEHFWNAVIRQTTVAGLITKDIESYGILKLSDSGRAFIQKPTPFMLIQERDFSNTDDDDETIVSAGGKGGAFDETLYDMLLDLRKSISKQRNIPPFVIFQDPSLKDMCFHYPISIDELTNIQGVGSGKATRYGEPFVALISKYVDEHDIERPQDMVIKSLVNKSGLKVQLIQNIDRKLPLEDIGRSQGKSFQEVIEEIEAIVSSGTRVNINYYIDTILDGENQEEIYDYFSEAETDDIVAAYHEFDALYTEEELRLMRIKFMSEMAN
jgi:ATP-dependent DNA helicase RecQ